MKDIGSVMKRLVRKDFSMSMKIPCGYMMKINATGSSTPSRDEPSVRVASPREEEKESKVSPRARATQHVGSSDPIAKAAEEEVEEEEIEDDALLADKKKRKRKPQGKKKGKAQPAASTAHEAEAALDEDGFAYSAVSYPLEIVSYDQEWCLKGAKGIQERS